MIDEIEAREINVSNSIIFFSDYEDINPVPCYKFTDTSMGMYTPLRFQKSPVASLCWSKICFTRQPNIKLGNMVATPTDYIYAEANTAHIFHPIILLFSLLLFRLRRYKSYFMPQVYRDRHEYVNPCIGSIYRAILID